jgi:hypothetical protein
MRAALKAALEDLEILSGDKVGPSGVSWQDVAGTCATNFQVLVWNLERARQGYAEPNITFPSPAECLEESHE